MQIGAARAIDGATNECARGQNEAGILRGTIRTCRGFIGP